MKVSCLIPFFNEQERIGKVLEQVVRVASIDEIICVDDGSTDGTSDFIKQYYPKIKLIINAKNLGKTEAIKAGLTHAKSEYILLLDADLRDFHFQEVDKAIVSMFEHQVDMIILRRMYALWTMKFVRGDILISGDRIVKRADLLQILHKKVTGYQLEFAINKYMQDKHKRVYWMPSSARNTYKFNKNGLIRGWYEMITVAVNILLFLGPKDYFKQLFFFCRKELI